MMKARDLMIDFINLIFGLCLISFCIFFFVYKDNFKIFSDIFITLLPISFFLILFLLKLKLDRKEHIRRRNRGDADIILRLTFANKILLDCLLFSCPIVVLLISLLDGAPKFTDLLQAAAVFLIFYFWQKYLFNKDTQ